MLKKLLAIGAVALLTVTSTGIAVQAAPTKPLAVAQPPISTSEAEGLQYMREEEKLAHDVYVVLHGLWTARIFANIAASEQQHMDAVAVLLDRYDISDPSVGNGPGEFTDPALQALYTDLVAQGSASLEGALRVGAAIEEIDILDLEERMAATTHADIRQVYQNLLDGSENHLRAFVSNLKAQTGVTYEPQYLDEEAYKAIIDGSNDSGKGGRNGRGGPRW